MLSIRRARKSDYEFLRSMLLVTLENETEDFVPEDLKSPGLSRYIEEWGYAGDIGFIASEDGIKLGAIWSRSVTEVGHGYGFYKEGIPEIAIAVRPDGRSSGVGGALIDAYFEYARKVFPAVSLSVLTSNPARRLYERKGFKSVSEEDGHTLMVFVFSE